MSGLAGDKVSETVPGSTRYTKQQGNFLKDLAWYQTIGHARDWLTLHFATREPFEGMRAFVEKRKPDYPAEGSDSPEFVHWPQVRTCSSCGTKGLPGAFDDCGKCGTKL